MRFEKGQLYHVYNRGNNKQPIFFRDENYLYFLRKIRKLVLPNCELLAYCLMPNHFHFLMYADERTVAVDDKGRNVFSEAIRKLLSQYTKAVNIQENRTSSLFQQNTNAKLVGSLSWHEHRATKTVSCHEHRGMIVQDDAINCFVYIHKNPMEMTNNNLSKWIFSSYLDYAGLRNGTLCNKELAYSQLGFHADEFLKMVE
jgi:putative transposase